LEEDVSALLLAEKAALRLIARAEQHSHGLALKLEKRGHEAAHINTVISRLSELNLINDRRYAQLWLESRLRLARSPRRLHSSLNRKGIDRDDAEAALNAALDEETEWAMLNRFVKKASRNASQNASRTKSKNKYSIKFLLKSEGFSQGIIERFLESLD